MATLFLLLIYLTFISLGLPDPLLGAVWPVMRLELGADLQTAGFVSMIITGGTVVASLASERVVGRFGAGLVTATSVLATAAALLGFSFAPSLWWMMALAVPLGLGAGAVDAAVNNFVALHYEARHMSWLHSFWGVGAFAGPLVMAAFLQWGSGWRSGYLVVGFFQLAVAALLFLSLSWWTSPQTRTATGASSSRAASVRDMPKMPALRIPGVPFALLTFLLYCAIEYSAGLWSSSYLAEIRGFSDIWAARGAAAFFGGITVGRLLNGFFTSRVTGSALIRLGMLLVMGGAILMALPLGRAAAFGGIIIIGLGCAPVYPCMIHETPRRFGAANSQKIIGLQMAAAYCGTTFLPPVVGMAASRFGLSILPVALLVLGGLMLACAERVNKAVRTGSAVKTPDAGDADVR